MLAFCLKLVSLPIIVILTLFNLRRILLTLAIFVVPPRRTPRASADDLPTVLVLVPCRDEEKLIDGLGRSLAELDYPADKLEIVLIDDGSRDRTCAEMQRVAAGARNMRVLALAENVGKGRALDVALSEFPFGEIVYVFDVDHRPQRETLQKAIRYFRAPEVAGVSGRTIPLNGLASPSAYYSTVESYVHQMITMRAKDRLALAPALLGSNCGYRRTALETCGGFPPGAFLEDSHLTLRLARAGYELRFAEDAVAYCQVPETVSGYLNQHTRWGRGFSDVAREYVLPLLQERHRSPGLRFELVMFALGYLDRLALLGACGLALATRPNVRYHFPRSILIIALVTPLVQVAALFAEQRVPRAMWLRLPLVPLLFALDVIAAARAAYEFVFTRRRVWGRTERARQG